MGIIELLLLSVGLAMDAFAISLCKGLELGKAKIRDMVIVGLWFGGFQALMPLIGYLLGSTFASYIEKFDHWIAFALLTAVGANMIKESFSKEKDKDESGSARAPLAFVTMLLLSLADSIDALAAGLTFAFLGSGILVSCLVIGLITFALSCAGVAIGSAFGAKFKSKAELAGGIILILLGVKVLLEHLGVINF